MKNNEALVILSDAIDLQKETLSVLREALTVLKATVEELKLSRVPNYVPTYVPYTQPQQPSWPTPYTNPTITCDGTQTLSNAQTCEAKSMGVFYSNTGSAQQGNVCGKVF